MRNQILIDKAGTVCLAYNRALASVFDYISETADPRDFDKAEYAEQVQRESLNAMASWFREPLAEIGESPAHFFDQLNEIDDLLAVYDVCANLCDEFLPEYFQIKLGKTADRLMPFLVERALALALDTTDDSAPAETFTIQCVSIELLGQWGNIAFADLLLENILAAKLMHERFASAAKAYFNFAAERALPPLKASIQRDLNASVHNPNLDYLLIFLTEVSKENHDEEAYQLLRSAFKKMPEKLIAVICLGDYGDGRAVPLLRAFFEQHATILDKALQAETLSSIKRLGGQIDDLRRQ